MVSTAPPAQQPGKALAALVAVVLATVAVVLALTVASAGRASAEITDARGGASAAAADTNCYLFEPSCYHELAGRTFSTTQSCYTYGIRYEDPTGYTGKKWVKCIAEPPSGTVHLWVFFFHCPLKYSVEYCKQHHYI